MGLLGIEQRSCQVIIGRGLQSTIRRRILRLVVPRGLLDADDAKDMGAWQHGGGYS